MSDWYRFDAVTSLRKKLADAVIDGRVHPQIDVESYFYADDTDEYEYNGSIPDYPAWNDRAEQWAADELKWDMGNDSCDLQCPALWEEARVNCADMDGFVCEIAEEFGNSYDRALCVDYEEDDETYSFLFFVDRNLLESIREDERRWDDESLGGLGGNMVGDSPWAYLTPTDIVRHIIEDYFIGERNNPEEYGKRTAKEWSDKLMEWMVNHNRTIYRVARKLWREYYDCKAVSWEMYIEPYRKEVERLFLQERQLANVASDFCPPGRNTGYNIHVIGY